MPKLARLEAGILAVDSGTVAEGDGDGARAAVVDRELSRDALAAIDRSRSNPFLLVHTLRMILVPNLFGNAWCGRGGALEWDLVTHVMCNRRSGAF